jgi:hypothetical protein
MAGVDPEETVTFLGSCPSSVAPVRAVPATHSLNEPAELKLSRLSAMRQSFQRAARNAFACWISFLSESAFAVSASSFL